MAQIQWDEQASLVRIVPFRTTEDQEEPIARGVLRELVGAFLEMAPEQQRGLAIVTFGEDGPIRYDENAIRELAAGPDYTGAHGAYDTADLPDDPDAQVEDDGTERDPPPGPYGARRGDPNAL